MNDEFNDINSVIKILENLFISKIKQKDEKINELTNEINMLNKRIILLENKQKKTDTLQVNKKSKKTTKFKKEINNFLIKEYQKYLNNNKKIE